MSKLSKPTKPKLISDKIYLHYIESEFKIDGFEFYNASDIDKLKENSISEILLQDFLDFNNDHDNNKILSDIVNKLKVGGILHIQSLDLRSLCNSLVYSQIDDNTFKAIVFGNGKTNLYSIPQIKELIKQTNLKINKIKFLNGLQYYIECAKI